MNTTAITTSTQRPPMTPLRKTALIAGVLYLVTFIFSIPVKFGLWKEVIDNDNFILGSGNGSGVQMGALFEIITALANIGTAVVLYKVARRTSERLALGYVTSRVMEAAVMFVGVLSILTIWTLRTEVAGTAGADSGSLLATGHALIAIHDWTFLIGPALFAAVNALCIGTVMYRSRLLPRWIPTLGLIGAPLLLASVVGVLFNAFDQVSGPGAVLGLPIALWELSFGLYMAFRGFKATSADNSAG